MNQQRVALTGRNTTGPPRAAAAELRCIWAALQTTDDDRRHRPLLVCPPTLCVGGPVIMYFTDRLSWKGNATGRFRLSVRLFPFYHLNELTFDLYLCFGMGHYTIARRN